MIRYYYKLYYDGQLLRDSRDYDDYYEDEEEAQEEGDCAKEIKIDQWQCDGAWHEDDSEDLFEIEVDYEEVDEDDE